ncbi:DNA excision repair protein ERCC-1-like [Styela clava]
MVNPCQRGNPVLDNICNVPWQYADKDAGMVPDYIMSATSCCLFLSLRYHALKPNYIYDRIQALRKSGQFSIRVLLGLVDVKEPAHAVKELAKAALVSEMTLLLAFSNEEAGTYLETFKAYRNKPADLIQTKIKKEFTARLAETLSSVKSVNSTDAHTLLSNYKNLSNVAKATEHDLALLPGLGGLKAKRLHDIFRQPFLKETKK